MQRAQPSARSSNINRASGCVNASPSFWWAWRGRSLTGGRGDGNGWERGSRRRRWLRIATSSGGSSGPNRLEPPSPLAARRDRVATPRRARSISGVEPARCIRGAPSPPVPHVGVGSPRSGAGTEHRRARTGQRETRGRIDLLGNPQLPRFASSSRHRAGRLPTRCVGRGRCRMCDTSRSHGRLI